jgi:hypothetical protein
MTHNFNCVNEAAVSCRKSGGNSPRVQEDFMSFGSRIHRKIR